MGISPPIQGQDLASLPDDTEVVAELAERDSVENVFPYFLGDADVGRFVTAFLVDDGTELALFARRNNDGVVDFENIDSRPVSGPLVTLGDQWDQTLIYGEDESTDTDDVDAVVDLRERARYETYWLFAGDDPAQSFEAYRRDPRTQPAPGFEDCEHVPGNENEHVPNLGFPISTCAECGTPLFLPETDNGTQSMMALNASHLDEAFGDKVIRSFRVDPTGDVDGREEALHVLSRLANNENPTLPLYARAGMQASVFLVGDQIVGYAAWQTVDDHVLLRTIYVLPEYRGEGGLAETIVQGFYEDVDDDSYFVETPNEPGRRALARAGHLDTGVAVPVATLCCRDTMDAAAPNSIYADPRPREFNPVY